MKSPDPERGDIPDAGQKVYTVSELNRQIRFLLESEYASVWVEGEVSNFKNHSSGHMYLTLKDDKSQVGAVFFSRHNQGLKFELKDGLKVIAFGKISLYEPRGQYQLYIEKLEPRGVGALQLAFLQLKEKLESEGLFAAERKKEIPAFPGVVGVVTSPTGAAIRDILNVVHRRFSGTRILLAPVKVQGEGAAEEIVRAIKDMNAFGEADVLIVGRGGGSLEDLWAFNEEAVARAVFASRIPVISAVGHEIDWTICDLAANLRAPTPSAAAELVVQDRAELERRLIDFRHRLGCAARGKLERLHEALEGLESSFAFKQPLHLVRQAAQRLDEGLRRLQNDAKMFTLRKRQAFQNLVGKLDALSPLAILERGYSLTSSESGAILTDSAGIKAGDVLRTRFFKGTVLSRVTAVEKTAGIHP